MTAKQRHVCEYCHGVITAPKRCSLERTIGIHIENCPAAHRGRKPAPVAQLAEASDSSSESVGSTPTGGTEQPRKRYIKRIVV